MTDPAPFLADLAEAPALGDIAWIRGDDGVRMRVGYWPGTQTGTVFLFPGRCEYIEKYGRITHEITSRGYHLLAIDWRGQGFADRLLKNPDVGHVRRFSDYQIDVRAYVAHATALGLPKPWLMLAHSMGGTIGLRALCHGQPFDAAVFSAPMWGIHFSKSLKALAMTLPVFAKHLGMGGRQAPKTNSTDFFLETPFEGNFLTTDRSEWDYMKRQAGAQARFRLAGPSLTWLAEAVAETRALQRIDLPKIPAHALVGSEEKLVDTEAIGAMAARWPSCGHTLMDGAEHELMMERPEIRRAFLDQTFRTFEKVGVRGAK